MTRSASSDTDGKAELMESGQNVALFALSVMNHVLLYQNAEWLPGWP
jgi:hypothetical protein